MFFFFFVKKIWTVIKMVFSYSSAQVASNSVFIWARYLIKIAAVVSSFFWIF